MNHSEKDIALVEKYFDAELNDSEMNHFTTLLESDQNFKTLVEQEKTIIGAIRHQGLTENLQYLKALEANLSDNSSVRLQAPIKRWYYVAAAVTIGVLIVGKVLLNTFNESPDQLFEAYFTPYPNMFEPTVRGNSAVNKRTQAFQSYDQGDYKNAAVLFTELLATNKEPGMLLLLGNANLILGNVEKAKENFTILNKDFDELDIQSKWYLSLCYLKSGDVERARAMLKELGKTEISYANKAKELLDKVD
jgi:tetratricopeptide (TPR) repeat protein